MWVCFCELIKGISFLGWILFFMVLMWCFIFVCGDVLSVFVILVWIGFKFI